MFGIATNNNISDELLNSYPAWDCYISHLWYCFFHFCDIKRDATVVEIAPGASPKIALALKKIDFCGKIYIVEPYEDALALITERYAEYLPQATLYPVAETLKQCSQTLPANPDFLVSHHCLDDMIIASNVCPNDLAGLFNWVTDTQLTVAQQFQQRWLDLQADHQQLELIQNTIIQDWESVFNQLTPTVVILSQYPSLVLDNYDLNSLNLTAQKLLTRLINNYQHCLAPSDHVQTLLNANKNYNYPLIANEVLNAKNWMLYQKSPPIV